MRDSIQESTKKIIVLGSTGSIGSSTLDVVSQNRDRFRLVGLSSHSNEEKLLSQMDEFDVPHGIITGGNAGSDRIKYRGTAALLDFILETDADIVLNGIPGAAGFLPSIAAIESGKHLALANKETMVMAGSLIRDLAEKRGKMILPVDSEHSAIFNLLRIVPENVVKEVIITASGGPFRDLTLEELRYVTVKDALDHPVWKMGRKITVDSATMGNKALEIIEAHELFDFSWDQIKTIIHPECFIHSLVRTRDNYLYAQVSSPTMSLPIHSALSYPEITYSPFGSLDLAGRRMTFRGIDPDKYRLMTIVYDVIKNGGEYPAVFNAANEAAVNAFLEERIHYLEIPSVVMSTLESDWASRAGSVEQILDADRKAREVAEQSIRHSVFS